MLFSRRARIICILCVGWRFTSTNCSNVAQYISFRSVLESEKKEEKTKTGKIISFIAFYWIFIYLLGCAQFEIYWKMKLKEEKAKKKKEFFEVKAGF